MRFLAIRIDESRGLEDSTTSTMKNRDRIFIQIIIQNIIKLVVNFALGSSTFRNS